MQGKPAKTFEDLIVWQKAHGLVLHIYRMTDGFPRREIFNVVAQLRDAAVSVPANIAEGFRRRGRLDKARFINISQGSLEETRYYLILSRDLGYAKVDAAMALLDEIGRMLNAYARAILASM